MSERLVAFGDLHLNWQATRVILDYARDEGINRAFNLGDEAAKFYPIETGDPLDYKRLFAELRAFRDETPERVLACVLGDKTAGVPSDLFKNYTGVSENGKIIVDSIIYRDGNILAAHNGQWILDKYEKYIKSWDRYEPLVILHSHSHSMGVLPKYKWLQDDEFVYWLEKGVKKYELKPRHVYWVNPGGNFFRDDEGKDIANFAIYDPVKQRITLQSVFFDKKTIDPH